MITNIKENNTLTFNDKCYELLKLIPKGKVTTYKAIANALGTQAYQAVGNAMAHNPTPIVVPCHRVVNSNGRIGQFALGQAKKVELLISEGIEIRNNKVQKFAQVYYDFSDIL